MAARRRLTAGEVLRGGGTAAMRTGSAVPVPGDEVGEQLQSGAVAFFRMELRREDISPGDGASKRRRIIRGAGGQRRDRPVPDDSCARSRSGSRRRCPPTADGSARCCTGLQPMCGTLSRSPSGSGHRRGRGSARPGRAGPPSPAVGPSSLASNSICRPRQMPRNGRVARSLDDRVAQAARVEAPHAIRHRALAGQHDPLRLTDDDRDPLVTTITRSGATCTSAFATERRLPIP